VKKATTTTTFSTMFAIAFFIATRLKQTTTTFFCFGFVGAKQAMAMNIFLWFHCSEEEENNNFHHLLRWLCCKKWQLVPFLVGFMKKMATYAFLVVLLRRR
jgi:hypothetical protein